MNRIDQASGKLIMQKYFQLLTDMWDFRLGNEIRKRREEEDGRLMEKYAEMEAKYEAKKLPKLQRGKVSGGRGETAGRGGAVGPRGAGGSTDGGGREEERRKGKIEA